MTLNQSSIGSLFRKYNLRESENCGGATQALAGLLWRKNVSLKWSKTCLLLFPFSRMILSSFFANLSIVIPFVVNLG